VIQTVLESVTFVRPVTCLTTQPTTVCVSFLFTFVTSTHAVFLSELFRIVHTELLCALNLTKHGNRFCITSCTFGRNKIVVIHVINVHIITVFCVCQVVHMAVCPVIQMVLAGVMFVGTVTCLTTRPMTAGVSFLFTFVISTHVVQYSYQNFFELYSQKLLCALI